MDRISYPSPQGHFSTSQSVLKWVKLNQLSARLMAGGPCHAIVIPLFPVSGPREALSLYAWGGEKIWDGARLQTAARNISQSTWAQQQVREKITHSLTHNISLSFILVHLQRCWQIGSDTVVAYCIWLWYDGKVCNMKHIIWGVVAFVYWIVFWHCYSLCTHSDCKIRVISLARVLVLFISMFVYVCTRSLSKLSVHFRI